jgi:hypothetical protein
MARDWFLQRRYTLLLLSLLLVFLLHPLLDRFALGEWVYDLLVTLVFLAAFHLLFRRRQNRVPAVLFGVPTLIAGWTGYALPGVPRVPLGVGFHLLAAVFLGFTVAAILQAVHEARAISTDSLAGAFSGYLLVGVAFSHLYCIAEALSPGSFRVPADMVAQLGDQSQRRYLFNYFSFITLTTVGYGDITPATQPARALACVEAVLGQFYIAVVMAELIGQKVSQPAGGGRPEPPPAGD